HGGAVVVGHIHGAAAGGGDGRVAGGAGQQGAERFGAFHQLVIDGGDRDRGRGAVGGAAGDGSRAGRVVRRGRQRDAGDGRGQGRSAGAGGLLGFCGGRAAGGSPSFPTRRSSDLHGGAVVVGHIHGAAAGGGNGRVAGGAGQQGAERFGAFHQ